MSAEHDLIARLFAPLATAPGAFDLLDDAALLPEASGFERVVTTDAIVEGVHFLPDDPPRTIGMKAVGVNLSDLAAKGASPEAAFLTLMLPPETDEARLAGFADGLGAACAAHGLALMGGDTVRAPVFAASLTCIGRVPAGRMVRRAGARAGDALYVSGTLGDAALGLRALLDGRDAPKLIDRYRIPRPRLALGLILADHARAAMDVSDGLIGDLDKMLDAARAQGGAITAVVRAEALPISEGARAFADMETARAAALTGGDDYEILCAVPPGDADAFETAAARAGTPVTRIGLIEAGDEPARAIDANGAEIAFAARAWSHR